MHRIVGLVAIALGASFLAGCGGASLQQIARQDSKELLGDPNPQILRTETVRIVDGEREAVAQLHGHFTIVPHCPMVNGPSKSRCHTMHPRYVVLTFGLPPSSSQGYAPNSRSQIDAIARARSAQHQLAIFPDFNGEIVRCAIPRANLPGGTIDGWELDYQQPFTFLPGFLKNFGVLANMTRLRSNIPYGTINSSGVFVVVAHNDILNLSHQTYNATLYYDDGTFEARMALAYRSKYLTAVPGQESQQDVNGTAATTNLDASATYKITKHFTLTAEAVNLTNEVQDNYVDSAELETYYHRVGRSFFFGARYEY